MMQISLATLKIGLTFFWALWLSLVFLTNLFAGLKVIRVLPDSWKFASKNYRAIAKATALYSSSAWFPGFLFAGVILWQALAAFLFWQVAINAIKVGSLDLSASTTAYAVSLGLWATFILADEIFKVYDGESFHLLILIAQLVTLNSNFLLSD